MAKELTRDEQRAQDRQDELDRQAKVEKAMEAHAKADTKEAEARLADPTRADKQEAERLAEIDKALNAASKAHDENAAKWEKFYKTSGIKVVEGKG